MATEFTGSGDPRRSIELLWGLQERGRRGPKPRLSAAEIVRAAIALADAEGLAAVSMRRLAETLGVSPMALYTYVPSKAELIDVMLDRAWGEAADPDDAMAGWRERLAFIARQRWALGQRHPWMLQIATHRPPLGPNVVAKFEAAFRAVDGLGLSAIEMELLVALVTDYVRGAVRSALDAREVERWSGITDAQWWALNEPVLKGVFDPAQFPLTVRVGDELRESKGTAYDPAASFEFGLQRVLDGIETFIAAHARPGLRTA